MEHKKQKLMLFSQLHILVFLFFDNLINREIEIEIMHIAAFALMSVSDLDARRGRYEALFGSKLIFLDIYSISNINPR